MSGQRIDYLSPTLYLTDIFIICLFFLQRLCFFRAVKPWQLSLLALLVPTIVFSISPLAGWYGLLKIFEFIFLGWYIATHTKQTLTFLQITFPIDIVTESVLAIWQSALQQSIGGIWYLLGERTFSASTPGIANASLNGTLIMRPYGTFSHPNVLAGFLLISIIFLAVVFRNSEVKKRMLIYFVEVVGAITLCLTLSRTVILLGVAFVILLAFHVIAFKSKKYAIQVLGGTVILCMVLGLILLPRFTGINLTGESLVLREQLLQAGWQMFVSHPFFGVGLNNFLPALPHIAPLLPLQPVHNVYLLVLSEIGLVGFLLFIFLLMKTIRHALSITFESQFMKNTKIFVLCSLFIFLMIGLVDHYFFTLQQGQLLSTLIFGLAWTSEKN